MSTSPELATGRTSSDTSPDPTGAPSRRGLIGPLVALVVIAVLAAISVGGGGDTTDLDAAELESVDRGVGGEDGDDGATSADDLAASADDVAASADDVAASADDVATSADDVAASADDVAASADDVAASADDALREQLEALATRDPADPRALGDADAPVVMIEWADFLCPFCQVVALDIEPELIERYVDIGVLRIEWRDLPMQGDGAVITALAGRAAAEQDAFWAMHGALFAAEYRRTDGRATPTAMVELADQLGLDVPRFEADLADEALLEQVATEAAQARSMGITGTPAFLINGRPVMGAQPAEVFEQLVREAAIEAGAGDVLP